MSKLSVAAESGQGSGTHPPPYFVAGASSRAYIPAVVEIYLQTNSCTSSPVLHYRPEVEHLTADGQAAFVGSARAVCSKKGRRPSATPREVFAAERIANQASLSSTLNR